jgi:TFIIF-interacting CTD phosphatase-like protein
VKETAGAAGSSVARAEKIIEKFKKRKTIFKNFLYVKSCLNHL